MLANVTDNIRLDRNIERFSISGDPGCDGYNVEAIIVLETILGRPADFHLLAGDLVPTGREKWLEHFAALVNRVSAAPVYCLAGNHDLPDYSKYCGRKDYFIKAPNALVVVLDNSRRYFSPETVEFLRETLEKEAGEDIFVAFHIPPPNPYIPNSVTPEEWAKVRDPLLPYRDRVRVVLAGHVHSGFEYDLDGFRVLVTGGAGSRLDKVENTFFPRNMFHAFEARYRDGAWTVEAEAIWLSDAKNAYAPIPGGGKVLAGLAETFAGEAMAHRRYLLYAGQAEAEGYPGVAKLFRAAADSEFHHSRAVFLAAGSLGRTLANVEESIRREEEEWTVDYPKRSGEASPFPSERAKNVYDCAAMAEKAHYGLFKKARGALAAGADIPLKRYFTCTRCGYTHEGDNAPSICPACGTDHFRCVEV